MQDQRDITFDIARAICILWVVGVWHLIGSYDEALSLVRIRWADMLTTITMSTFFFISGYFLGKKEFDKWKDVVSFYKKRFIRLYVLFFVSVISIYIGGLIMPHQMITSPKQLFLTLLGLTTLFPPQAGQFWFVSMLLLFYLFTPAILCSRKKVLRIIVICFLFLLLYLYKSVHALDERVFMYLFIYSFALTFGNELYSLIKKNAISFSLIGGCITICVLMICTRHDVRVDMAYMCLISLIGIVGILGGAYLIHTKIMKNSLIETFFSAIAYLSMSAYLFHRQCFSVIKAALGHLFGWGVDYWMMYGVMLPVTLVVSYYIQFGYDATLKRINH